MDSLKGKVAIITGASSGIGAGVAVHLAGLGCKLLLTGRTQEKLDKVAAECRKSGLSAIDMDTLSGDITTHATRMLVIERAIERWDQIDILFNNSGIMCNMSLLDVSKVDYDLTFDNNVRCHVLMAKATLPHLVKTKVCGARRLLYDEGCTGHVHQVFCSRSFQMKTYKSRTYEAPQDIGICIDDDLEPDVTLTEQTNQSTEHNDITYQGPNFDFTEGLSAVQIRDHMFDKRTGRKSSKHVRISKWNEQPKGVRPVRYYYKIDETQILPSLRFGIPDADLEEA